MARVIRPQTILNCSVRATLLLINRAHFIANDGSSANLLSTQCMPARRIKISAELARRKHLTGGGKPYVASAVQAMLAA